MTRDLRLDSLKGFLILLVVYAHVPFSYFQINKTIFLSNISDSVYFFHMPLFLAVSALFIKNDYSWLLKRAYLVLIPYLFWFFYGHLKLLIASPIDFIEIVVIGNWQYLKSILWFLPALFSLNLLVFFFERSSKLYKIIILSSSILVFVFSSKIIEVHEHIPFGIDIAIYLFVLVYLIKKIYEHQTIIEKINIISLLLIILLTIISLFYFEPVKTHTQWHKIVDLAQFSIPVTFIGYVSFLFLNISIFVLFLKMKELRVLSYIGFYSFPIFLLHLMVLYKLPNFFSTDSMYLNILFLIITIVLSIVLPIFLSKIMMKFSDKFKYIGMVK